LLNMECQTLNCDTYPYEVPENTVCRNVKKEVPPQWANCSPGTRHSVTG